MLNHKSIRWLLVVLWMAFIFFLSSRQTTGITGESSFTLVSVYWQRFIILKFFHLVEYSILFVLLSLALNATPKSVLIAYLYACSDEFHQSFVPGRTSRFRDTLIDLVGIIIGYILLKIIKHFLLTHHPKDNITG